MTIELTLRHDVLEVARAAVDVLHALQSGDWKPLAEVIRDGWAPVRSDTVARNEGQVVCKQLAAADWVEVAGDVSGKVLADPRGAAACRRVRAALDAHAGAKVDEAAAQELAKALDLRMRVHLGQLEAVVDILQWDQVGISWEDPTTSRRLGAGIGMLRAAKGELGFLPAGSLGIRHVRVDAAARACLALHRQIKDALDSSGPTPDTEQRNDLFRVVRAAAPTAPSPSM